MNYGGSMGIYGFAVLAAALFLVVGWLIFKIVDYILKR